jgi:hypothetical protein
MTKEFVKYEIALALEELGFDEPVINVYDLKSKELVLGEDDEMIWAPVLPNNGATIAAPLYQQTFRWFRDKHGLDFNTINTNMWTTFSFVINDIPNKNPITTHLDFNTKEEAESACLDKLIEIVKTNNICKNQNLKS